MAWTPQQIRTAAIAARAAGWNDEQRRMVLSSLGGRAVHEALSRVGADHKPG